MYRVLLLNNCIVLNHEQSMWNYRQIQWKSSHAIRDRSFLPFILFQNFEQQNAGYDLKKVFLASFMSVYSFLQNTSIEHPFLPPNKIKILPPLFFPLKAKWSLLYIVSTNAKLQNIYISFSSYDCPVISFIFLQIKKLPKKAQKFNGAYYILCITYLSYSSF